MLFTSTGDFIDEIEFKDLKDEQARKRAKKLEFAKKPFRGIRFEFNTENKQADENEEGTFINEYKYVEIKQLDNAYKRFSIQFW